jgi:hypothetical protein
VHSTQIATVVALPASQDRAIRTLRSAPNSVAKEVGPEAQNASVCSAIIDPEGMGLSTAFVAGTSFAEDWHVMIVA